MLREDAAEVMGDVDAVIVCHSNEIYRKAVSTGPDIPVIDVVRLFNEPTYKAQINGIGW